MNERDAVQEARNLIQTEMEKTLLQFPMWMRFRYFCNTLNHFYAEGYTDEDINWNHINEILTTNVSEYDFNYFNRIETGDELSYVNMFCCQSSVFGGAWQKHICKDCGEEFYMSYSEVKFFESKELHIPRRCKTCREKRKRGK